MSCFHFHATLIPKIFKNLLNYQSKQKCFDFQIFKHSLHIFVLLNFNLITQDSRDNVCMTNILNILRLTLLPRLQLMLVNFLIHLKRTYIPLLLGGVLYKCPLDQVCQQDYSIFYIREWQNTACRPNSSHCVFW